ncbi:MAG: hypothetical protein K0S07_1005 [Chlamydiales bacterium]|nr:hypothetical protein [Chlamydiales bacterium]
MPIYPPLQGLDKGSSSEPNDLLNPLKQALQNLSQFLCLDESASYPLITLYHIDAGEPAITRDIAGFSKGFFASLFDTHSHVEAEHKKQQIVQNLQQSIDTIKSYYPSLERFQSGSPSEQDFLLLVLSLIHRFNLLAAKVSVKPSSLKDTIARHFYQKAGWLLNDALEPIILPPLQKALPSIHQHQFSLQPIAGLEVHKIASFAQDFYLQERDLFIMKAATLVGAQELSTLEAVKKLRAGMCSIRVKSEKAQTPEKSIISIQQQISSFPGEALIVEGEFERPLALPDHPIPIVDSFHFSKTSKQTGFPYPSQYCGFALSEKLIPFCPQRIASMPLFAVLYEKKWAVAKELFPEGRFYERAKKNLQLKKTWSDQAKERFVALHEEFALSMCEAANQSGQGQAIRPFFKALAQIESPFAHLSEVYQLISEAFIQKLLDKLYEDWPSLLIQVRQETDLEKRRSYCEEVFQKEELKNRQELIQLSQQASSELQQATFSFILALGPILAGAAKGIFLQHLSEHLKFPPPELSSFQKKVQIALYRQLLTFLEECEALSLEPKSLFDLLEKDVNLFKNEAVPSDLAAQVADELESYYLKRSQ